MRDVSGARVPLAGSPLENMAAVSRFGNRSINCKHESIHVRNRREGIRFHADAQDATVTIYDGNNRIVTCRSRSPALEQLFDFGFVELRETDHHWFQFDGRSRIGIDNGSVIGAFGNRRFDRFKTAFTCISAIHDTAVGTVAVIQAQRVSQFMRDNRCKINRAVRISIADEVVPILGAIQPGNPVGCVVTTFGKDLAATESQHGAFTTDMPDRGEVTNTNRNNSAFRSCCAALENNFSVCRLRPGFQCLDDQLLLLLGYLVSLSVDVPEIVLNDDGLFRSNPPGIISRLLGNLGQGEANRVSLLVQFQANGC